jgi:hypothetical protein
MSKVRRSAAKPKGTPFEEAKAAAPEIPDDTCPYIDFIQETVGKLERKDSAISQKQILMLSEALEYLRTCNDSLRKSSKYWYDCYKRDIGKEP